MQILIVDDRPDDEARGIAARLTEDGVSCRALHPSDIDEGDLQSTDLLLVDFELNSSSWDQSDLPLANRCENGWALASVLRWQMAAVDNRPTPGLVALLTNEIDKALVPFDMGGNSAAGIISALNGVEWVFSKQGDSHMLRQVAHLARSISTVRSTMSPEQLLVLLKAPEGVSYKEDLLNSGMPATELLDWREGVAIFRWMMQRVLPYPTFLISDLWLASRLGIGVPCVERLLDSGSPLGERLSGCLYEGLLSDFLGRRWWTREVDRVIWDATDGESSSLSAVRRVVGLALNEPVAEIAEGGDSPVVVLDQNFREEPHLADAAGCQRVRPEWWPAFASDVWARNSEIADCERLQSALL